MSKEVKEIGKMGALALLSQMPVVSAFSKFFEDYVNSNWQKRIELWKEETIKRLSKLDQDMEQKIRDMSNFANILATAQRGALEDIEEDKVGLYINAVINAIKNENIDNMKTHIFLNMLRRYTLAHIETLMYFNNPAKYFSFIKKHNIHGAILYHISGERFSQEAKNVTYEQREIEHIIIKELTEELLIYPTNHIDKVILNWGRLSAPITTQLGQEFLQFIAEQEKNNG